MLDQNAGTVWLDMDAKTAVTTGKVEALRALLGEDPSRADGLIRWGDEGLHPNTSASLCL